MEASRQHDASALQRERTASHHSPPPPPLASPTTHSPPTSRIKHHHPPAQARGVLLDPATLSSPPSPLQHSIATSFIRPVDTNVEVRLDPATSSPPSRSTV